MTLVSKSCVFIDIDVLNKHLFFFWYGFTILLNDVNFDKSIPTYRQFQEFSAVSRLLVSRCCLLSRLRDWSVDILTSSVGVILCIVICCFLKLRFDRQRVHMFSVPLTVSQLWWSQWVRGVWLAFWNGSDGHSLFYHFFFYYLFL